MSPLDSFQYGRYPKTSWLRPFGRVAIPPTPPSSRTVPPSSGGVTIGSGAGPGTNDITSAACSASISEWIVGALTIAGALASDAPGDGVGSAAEAGPVAPMSTATDMTAAADRARWTDMPGTLRRCGVVRNSTNGVS